MLEHATLLVFDSRREEKQLREGELMEEMAPEVAVLEKGAQLGEGEDVDDVEVRSIPGSDDDEPAPVNDVGNSIELIAGPVNVSPSILEAEVKEKKRSVYLLDYTPLWGSVSICGRRPEMEDAVVVVPRFFEIPLQMVAGDRDIDGLDPCSVRLPAHFFGVYDGHGGAQVEII